MNILGVMTGTSCDSLDAACIRVHQEGHWTPLWSATASYPPALRRRVLDVQRPKSLFSSQSWLELDRDLGEWYGAVLGKLIKRHKISPDVIANHGQTIAHFPQTRSKGVTAQLGDPARIACATGLTVVSNFRGGDMAAGGQGAPLVPLFHSVLAALLDGRRPGSAIHNLGGFSNLTYFGPKGVLAFDTGPASIWIDAAIASASNGKLQMDRGGRMAARGVAESDAVKRLLRHPFFGKDAPKSTGRDDFPFSYFTTRTKAKGADLVATATALSVASIVGAYQRFILDQQLPLNKIYFCGGGAKNATLLDGVRRGLPGVQVSDLTAAGFDSQLIEAQAFAYYGFLSLAGKPLGGPWTGACDFGPPGQILPGANWLRILKFFPRR